MKVLVLGPAINPLIVRLRKCLELNGVEVLTVSFGIKNNPLNNEYSLGPLKGFHSYLYSKRLREIITAEKPDLIHSHIINHYGILSSTLRSIPTVLTLWGSDVMLAPKRGSWLKKNIFRFINSFVFKSATLVHSSSEHVIDEAKKQAKVICSDNCYHFYWGMPLPKLTLEKKSAIQSKLNREFSITADEFITFPRGVANNYSPDMVIDIVNLWDKINPDRSIIIFKAFSSNNDWQRFRGKIKNKNAVFIDRLLNDEELSYIYSKTICHFSLPISDNLGGGVIEPLQMGSYPVLSDIEPYRLFSTESEATIVKSSDSNVLSSMILSLENKTYERYHNDHFSNPTTEMINLYKLAIDA
jgi:hypothetical protein